MADAFVDVKSIFWKARALDSPEARDAFLAEACADDSGLRAEVDSLLRAHQEAAVFFAAARAPATATVDPPPDEGPGTLIGSYKLVESIGEGGMGSVFLAQQAEPVKRLVAVKLIKIGMDSSQVLARFETERQALAMMDHPNIAKVLDAGATDSGRPFFVMELIRGVPITQYCDANRLTPRQRLELFVPVCQAVQHAHQKGVIHRDIKPSNVLVARYDDRPTPKVIDFGVAKAAGQGLAEKTSVTGLGVIVGTPEYMSPEQATLDNNSDIDTRSDVYSLGVLLYELLAGSPPFTCKDMEQPGVLEMLRAIRIQEPSKPSTKLSTSEGLPTLAANRGTEPAKLTRLVRGELDWVVMKALEKDRKRRYETASALAMDLSRYLANEPVLACPQSAGYRLRKFARRNRGPVLAASLVALALLVGIIGTTVGLVRADQRAEGERQAKETAEKRLAQIERGIDLLGSLLADLDPFAEEKEGRPLRAILGDRLDRAAADLEGESIGDHLVVARLQDRLGQTYLGLGHTAKAEALFTKAATTREAHLGADHPDTLSSRHNLALANERAGNRTEAIKQFEQVHAARVKVLGAEHVDTLRTLNDLAVGYWRAGKPAEAVPLLEQVRDRRVKLLGEDHDDTLATLQDLAGAYRGVNKKTEAIVLAEKVWEAWVRKRGDDNPRSLAAMESLAYTYQAGYQMRQALALYEQARDKIVPKLGDYHPLTLKILYGLAHMQWAFGDRSPATIALFEQVRERQVMVLGGYHPSTLVTLNSLALAYQEVGEPRKALPLFEQAAAGVERLGFAHSEAHRIVYNLASFHERSRQYEQAEKWRRKWVAVAREKYGPEDLMYVGVQGLAGLGANLLHQKKFEAAEPILRESLAALEKKQSGSWETYRTQTLLGEVLLGQRKYDEADTHLTQGYRGMKQAEGDMGGRFAGPTARQRMTQTLERVAELYEGSDKPAEAAKWRKELEALRKEKETLK